MKRFLVSVLLVLAFYAPALAFVPFGNIDGTLDYADLVISPRGSQMTVINKSSIGREEFYIIVTGSNFRDSMVYRHRQYVDFIPGNGAVSFGMPAYPSNDSIFTIRFEIRKPREMDVRIR